MAWICLVFVRISIRLFSDCTLSCKSDSFFLLIESFCKPPNLIIWRQPYLLCRYIIYNLIMLLFVHSNRWFGLSHLKFSIYLGLFSTEFYYFVSARQRTFLNFCFRAAKRVFLSWSTFYSTLFTPAIMPPLTPLCPSFSGLHRLRRGALSQSPILQSHTCSIPFTGSNASEEGRKPHIFAAVTDADSPPDPSLRKSTFHIGLSFCSHNYNINTSH